MEALETVEVEVETALEAGAALRAVAAPSRGLRAGGGGGAWGELQAAFHATVDPADRLTDRRDRPRSPHPPQPS